MILCNFCSKKIEILAVESKSANFLQREFVYAHYEDRDYPISNLLKDLEEQLYTHGFARIHKTYLANLDKIELIDLHSNKITINNTTIPIGYVYRKKMLGRLNLLR